MRLHGLTDVVMLVWNICISLGNAQDAKAWLSHSELVWRLTGSRRDWRMWASEGRAGSSRRGLVRLPRIKTARGDIRGDVTTAHDEQGHSFMDWVTASASVLFKWMTACCCLWQQEQKWNHTVSEYCCMYCRAGQYGNKCEDNVLFAYNVHLWLCSLF